MHAFITINGKQFPAPARGIGYEIATTVSNGRNANNEFVGQKVGRDQQKVDNLSWPHLSAAVWSELLQEFEKFDLTVTYPDPVHNTWKKIKMYPGNRTADVFKVNPQTGLPSEYINCKCNIIDCGLLEE